MICTRKRTTRHVPWFVSTSYRIRWWRKHGNPCPPHRGNRRATTTSIGAWGTCNLFACFEPKAGRRQIRVTQRRTSGDFAEAMRWLIDEGYPEAETVRVVPDNLNTHTGAAGALWAGTKRLRLRKHDASCARWRSITRQSTDRWLNQGEIAWSVLTQQCLERRIGDIETLRREVGAWERERNAAKATVQWRFGGEKARVKLARLYPSYLLS